MTDRNRSKKNVFLKGVLLLVIICLFLMPGLPFTTANIVRAAGVACPAGQRCVYVPVVVLNSVAPASSNDLFIKNVEVMQAVQDPQNSVPLVAGRKTILRVTAQGSGSGQMSSNITVSISARHKGAMLEGELDVISADISPQMVAADNAGGFVSTVNVEIPADWLQGSYDLLITLDSQNIIPESNEANNTYVQHVTFTQVPPLRIKIVPIIYTHTPTGVTYSAPGADTISDYIRRIYPVSQVEITWHAPYAFSGDMKQVSSFSKLLSEMNTLKASEKAPSSQVYYALVPTQNGQQSWFGGGVVGIGYVGHRVAVGLDYANAGQTAAHEIGHNLGQNHAPCGNPSGADKNYPYNDAAIGKWGMDLITGKLYPPDSTKDIMSYCTPKWISDYTYKALYTSQLQKGAAPDMVLSVGQPSPEQPELLFRAQISADGVSFMPVYMFSGASNPVPATGEYIAQLIGAQGELLSEIPVEAYEIAAETEELEAHPIYEIQSLIPLPEETPVRVRLVKNGQILAEQDVNLPNLNLMGVLSGTSPAVASNGIEPAIAKTEQGMLELTWDNPDLPALVRYSVDGSRTWTTLGVDVIGGKLVIDPANLPEGDGVFSVISSSSLH